MDVELREIRDFLAEHPPWASLPPRVLDELPGRLHVRYYRRGTTIIGLGTPNNSLFILRSGAVDIHRDGDDLVERADPGTSFGTSSVLSRRPSEYRIVAIEDSLVLVMPGEVFGHLLACLLYTSSRPPRLTSLLATTCRENHAGTAPPTSADPLNGRQNSA